MKLKNEFWPIAGTLALGVVGVQLAGASVWTAVGAASVKPDPASGSDAELVAATSRRTGLLICVVTALGAFACYKGVVAVNR